MLIAALELLWQLENRGLSIEQEGEQLAVGPRALLTDADRENIRRHRDALKLLIVACEAVQ